MATVPQDQGVASGEGKALRSGRFDPVGTEAITVPAPLRINDLISKDIF
jgi:hypothetical protein